MADGIEMINMNFNMNSANMGNVGAIGAAELSQGQTVTDAGTLQSMETLAASMTTPGNGDVSSNVMSQIGDNGTEVANIEGGMNRLDACGNYLDNCERIEGQGQALSGMMDQINGDGAKDLAFYQDGAKGNAEAGLSVNGASQSQPANASNAEAGQSVNGTSQSQSTNAPTAEGGKVSGAKVSDGSALMDQAAQKAENAARNGQVPVDGVQAPKNPQMGQDAKMTQNGKQGQVSDDLQSAAKQNMATSTKTVKATEKTVADNTAKAATAKKQEAARQEATNKEAAAKEETAKEEQANQEAEAEAVAEETAQSEANANTSTLSSSSDVSSVLTQYLQQNTDLNATQINALVNDYSSQATTSDLDSLYSNLDRDAAKMAEGTYRSANYNPAEDESASDFMNNPLDLVGSTAMSTNMANLESLVNMDLMEKFTSGSGLTSMGE